MAPFITFEGIEGCGKSTQIGLLARSLEEKGVAHLLTREPGGTVIGDQIRRLLLHPASEMNPTCELLLYAAARAQHVDEVIRPALAGGRVVLCDRYTDATRAYQGSGRGLPTEVIERLHALDPLSLEPDRTVLIDLDPAVALSRAGERNRAGPADETRFDNETLAFHTRVRQGYLDLARRFSARFAIVDGRGSIAEVQARVRAALAGVA